MIKRLALFLVVLGSSAAVAEVNPFAHCENAPGHATYFNCRIAVVDEYLKEEFGSKALKDANELVERECKSVGANSKMAPKLRLLAALDCEFRVKLDYYEELAK